MQRGGEDSLTALALKICLEEALVHCLGVTDVEVIVDHEKNAKALCFYEVGKDISLQAAREIDPLACYGDLVPRVLDMGELPSKVVRRVKERFPAVLEDLRTERAYWVWKKKVHRAVEGVIIKVTSQAVWVDLGGQVGIMPRSHWIPKEIPDYKPGRAFWFYVLKINKKRDGRALRVYLSRNSINLPAALLKEMVPGVRARCIRRVAGAKSWLVLNRRLERRVLAKLGGRLGGEWVEITLGGVS